MSGSTRTTGSGSHGQDSQASRTPAPAASINQPNSVAGSVREPRSSAGSTHRASKSTPSTGAPSVRSSHSKQEFVSQDPPSSLRGSIKELFSGSSGSIREVREPKPSSSSSHRGSSKPTPSGSPSVRSSHSRQEFVSQDPPSSLRESIKELFTGTSGSIRELREPKSSSGSTHGSSRPTPSGHPPPSIRTRPESSRTSTKSRRESFKEPFPGSSSAHRDIKSSSSLSSVKPSHRSINQAAIPEQQNPRMSAPKDQSSKPPTPATHTSSFHGESKAPKEADSQASRAADLLRKVTIGSEMPPGTFGSKQESSRPPSSAGSATQATVAPAELRKKAHEGHRAEREGGRSRSKSHRKEEHESSAEREGGRSRSKSHKKEELERTAEQEGGRPRSKSHRKTDVPPAGAAAERGDNQTSPKGKTGLVISAGREVERSSDNPTRKKSVSYSLYIGLGKSRD